MATLEALRGRIYRIIDPLTDSLVRREVHPNLLTTLGFGITMSSALFFHQHHVRTAGFLILLGGFFDIIDGRVARLSGLGSKFGAFYDSTLDRISEIAVFIGILSLYNDYRLQLGDVGMIYLIMLAMAGSLMVSYTRGRAEALGLDCQSRPHAARGAGSVDRGVVAVLRRDVGWSRAQGRNLPPRRSDQSDRVPAHRLGLAPRAWRSARVSVAPLNL